MALYLISVLKPSWFCWSLYTKRNILDIFQFSIISSHSTSYSLKNHNRIYCWPINLKSIPGSRRIKHLICIVFIKNQLIHIRRFRKNVIKSINFWSILIRMRLCFRILSAYCALQSLFITSNSKIITLIFPLLWESMWKNLEYLILIFKHM